MRLFDLHCDTLYECETRGCSLESNPLHIDLRRGCRYAPWRQVFAVWMPDTLRGEAAFERCCAVLDYARQQADKHPNLLHWCTDSIDVDSPCGGLLAVEGGSALAGRLDTIEALAARGVRLLTLTWNGSNELGHGSLSDCVEGLTAFGKRVVSALERQGLVVDVSHLNDAGFWDVAQQAQRPFIASHSLSRTVTAHPRNLTDQQFSEICRRKGVVGVNYCTSHRGGTSPEKLYRHIDHFLSLGGEQTVAVGGDLDGTKLPSEWGGIAFAERLADFLSGKGYSDELIDRIFFVNAAEFFRRHFTIDN